MLESNWYELLETTEEMNATKNAQTLEENKAAKNIATNACSMRGHCWVRGC